MLAARIECPPTETPYAAAEVAFGQAKAYLSSREAQQMSESDLERALHRRGQELMRKLLQGHLEQRRPCCASSASVSSVGRTRWADRMMYEACATRNVMKMKTDTHRMFQAT